MHTGRRAEDFTGSHLLHHRMRLWRDAPLTATLGAVGAGIVVTTIIIADSSRLRYRNLPAHLVLETLTGCIAVLAAYLFYGRFRRTGYLQDLLLVLGLGLLALAGLAFTVVATLVAGERTGVVDVCVPLAVRALAAGCIAIASLVPGVALRTDGWQRRATVLAVALGVSIVVVYWRRPNLPTALDVTTAPGDGESRLVLGHPVLVAAQTFTAACFALACVRFTAHSSRRSDPLLRWLGPAFALAAFSRINYILFPSIYSDWLYSGDVLRAACYLVLLIGASIEIRQYWENRTHEAVTQDRRRLARELHDGVLQELVYIRNETRSLCALDRERADRIIGACDRASDEARSAVDALGRPGGEPFAFILHRATHQVAERYGLTLEVDIEDSVDATPQQRHALLRIAREAIGNAARHGKATRVTVFLVEDEGTRRLQVSDDGDGFDPAAVAATTAGFGLTSMSERASAMPGTFRLESARGDGTTVTVMW